MHNFPLTQGLTKTTAARDQTPPPPAQVLLSHVVPDTVLSSKSIKTGHATLSTAASTPANEVDITIRKLASGFLDVLYNSILDLNGDAQDMTEDDGLTMANLTFEGPFVAGTSTYIIHPVDEVMVPSSLAGKLHLVQAGNKKVRGVGWGAVAWCMDACQVPAARRGGVGSVAGCDGRGDGDGGRMQQQKYICQIRLLLLPACKLCTLQRCGNTACLKRKERAFSLSREAQSRPKTPHSGCCGRRVGKG